MTSNLTFGWNLFYVNIGCGPMKLDGYEWKDFHVIVKVKVFFGKQTDKQRSDQIWSINS